MADYHRTNSPAEQRFASYLAGLKAIAQELLVERILPMTRSELQTKWVELAAAAPSPQERDRALSALASDQLVLADLELVLENLSEILKFMARIGGADLTLVPAGRREQVRDFHRVCQALKVRGLWQEWLNSDHPERTL